MQTRFATAGALAAAYAEGQCDPETVTAACLEAIAAENPHLNAVTAVDDAGAQAAARASAARWRAGAACGPLDGAPVAVKDNIDVAGLPTTAGFAALRGRVAERDAEAVARLRAGGAVVLGKLNMEEGALGAVTDNPHFGRTENPHRPGFTPGGSSGGSGAAVAAGFCALALGTDTLGSVRIPAAYCGVYALKATRGRISGRGQVPLSWTLDHIGPLARSVSDLAAALQVLSGLDAEDPGSVATPGDAPAFDPGAALTKMTLVRLDEVEAAEMETAVRGVAEKAMETLAGSGARVTRARLGIELAGLRRAGLALAEAEASVALGAEFKAHGEGFSQNFRSMLAYGAGLSATALIARQRRLAAAGPALRRALGDADAIVMPTTPQTAFSFDAEPPSDQADFTALANAAGWPAVTLPCGWSDDGLPVGLQLIGRPFDDGRLLSLAAAADRALAAYRPPRKENSS